MCSISAIRSFRVFSRNFPSSCSCSHAAAKPAKEPVIVVGAISTEAEEEELEALNDWVEAQGLPRGVLAFDFADPVSGEQKAVFDLAWPDGIQQELSQPVAVLLNEGPETIRIASGAGFRCFTSVRDFKDYVKKEILAGEVQVFDGEAVLSAK